MPAEKIDIEEEPVKKEDENNQQEDITEHAPVRRVVMYDPLMMELVIQAMNEIRE